MITQSVQYKYCLLNQINVHSILNFSQHSWFGRLSLSDMINNM